MAKLGTPFGSAIGSKIFGNLGPTGTVPGADSLTNYLALNQGKLPPQGSDIATFYNLYPNTAVPPTVSSPVMTNLTNSLGISSPNINSGLLLLGLGALILLFAIR